MSIVTCCYLLDIYVKVSLYEGRKLIKAKKTRALPCCELIEFNEKFSIRLPPTYLDNVSCRLSLCYRNKFGVKSLMGRTSVGPFAFANGQGKILSDMTKISIVEVLGLVVWDLSHPLLQDPWLPQLFLYFI